MADAARAKWSGPAKRARAADDDDFVVPDDAPLDGSAAAGAAAGGKKKRAPAPFVDAIIAELSSQRKLTVGKFNGKFYEKDGQTLPGKKGISLTVEQWATLVAAAPAVEAALAALKK